MQKLQRLRELPRLPGRRSADFEDLTIAGATVRVYKATSDRTVPVSARLMALLGDELYQLVSHDGEEDEDAGPLSVLLGLDFDDEDDIKTAMIGTVLPLLYEKASALTNDSGPGSLFWYFERLLTGNVEYAGTRIEDISELDTIGFTVPEITKMFWVGVRIAFFPTQDAPDTNVGAKGPGTSEAETQSPRQEILSFSAESSPTLGQSAPT
jgi:hypothetical protein